MGKKCLTIIGTEGLHEPAYYNEKEEPVPYEETIPHPSTAAFHGGDAYAGDLGCTESSLARHWDTNDWDHYENDPEFQREDEERHHALLSKLELKKKKWVRKRRSFSKRGDKSSVRKCEEVLAFIDEDVRNLEGDNYRTGYYLLTSREKEILDFMRSGMSQAEVARELSISRPAVSQTMKRIEEKTNGVATRHLLKHRHREPILNKGFTTPRRPPG